MLKTGDATMLDTRIERRARLFRNGRNQAVRIPREFELPGQEVIIRKDGDRLIVEPVKKYNNLAELLASWEDIEEEFPEIEDPPVKPEDIF
jgi:antitoxin VapB